MLTLIRRIGETLLIRSTLDGAATAHRRLSCAVARLGQ
jgi:hypothetical protein